MLRAECQVRFQRRSGPGGQHRNKVETCVVLTHQPTGIVAQASERRQQAANLRVAWQRLRIQLALQVRVRRQRPSPLWQSRCSGGRITISRQHEDFPAVLAEALDFLHQSDQDVPAAAEQLSCTSSQLIRLLKLEPAAWGEINRRRAEAGRHPLR